MANKQTPIDWLMEQYYDSEGKLTRQNFDEAQQMYYSDIQDTFNDGCNRTQEMVIKMVKKQMDDLNK